MSRTAERADFDQSVRLRLVEKDLDDNDLVHEGIRQEIAGARGEMNEAVAGFREDLAANRQVLMGILVAVTVASIMLALNLVVR